MFKRIYYSPISRRYLMWCAACLVCLLIFYVSTRSLSIYCSVNVIKIVSLFGIFLTILEWMLSVGEYVHDEMKKERQKRRALWAAFWTFVVVVVLLVIVVSEPDQPLTVSSQGVEWFLVLIAFGSNVIAVFPIAALAYANHCTIEEEGGSALANGAQLFLWYVDLPCLVASGTVFILAMLGYIIARHDQVVIMLSGAMAFLVFVVFFTDIVIKTGIYSKRNANRVVKGS